MNNYSTSEEEVTFQDYPKAMSNSAAALPATITIPATDTAMSTWWCPVAIPRIAASSCKPEVGEAAMKAFPAACFTIALLLWLSAAVISFVLMPLTSGDGGAMFAGNMHLEEALKNTPDKIWGEDKDDADVFRDDGPHAFHARALPIIRSLRLAKEDCYDTPWTSPTLRASYDDLAIKWEDYIGTLITADEFREAVKVIQRQTVEEGRAAHAGRWSRLNLALWVGGLLFLGVFLGVTALSALARRSARPIS